MSDPKRIQYLSLLGRSNELCSQIPGMECEVCMNDLSLTPLIGDERALCNYFRCLPQDLEETISGFKINLKSTTTTLTEIKDLLIHTMVTEFSPLETLKQIPIVSVADKNANAEARSDGIVTISHSLITKLELLIMSTMVFMQFDSVFMDSQQNRIERDDFNSQELTKAIGTVVMQFQRTQASQGFPAAFDIVLKSLCHLRDVHNIQAATVLNSMQMRILAFIVFHEFGHVILKHHTKRSVIAKKLPNETNKAFYQEYEADMMAVAGYLRTGAMFGLDRSEISIQLMASIGMLMISEGDLFDGVDNSGRPNLPTRLGLIAKGLYGDNWASEYPEVIQLLAGFTFLQKIAEEQIWPFD